MLQHLPTTSLRRARRRLTTRRLPRFATLAVSALGLSAAAAAQNGQSLPFLGGNLQGLPPTHANQTWPSVDAPALNPFSPSIADPFQPTPLSLTDQKRILGKITFWDEQLSSDNTMSCGSCHDQGGMDSRGGFQASLGGDGSLGVAAQDASNSFVMATWSQFDRQVTEFNPPSVTNAVGFKDSTLWRGNGGPMFNRLNAAGVLVPFMPGKAALEAQAAGPPTNDVEMCRTGLTWPQVTSKLGPALPLALATNIPPDIAPFVNLGLDYNTLYDAVFGTHPVVGGNIGPTRERVAMAIATYERTLVPNQAPIDTRLLTNPPQANIPSEMRGFNLFVARRCTICHSDSNSNRSPGPVALRTAAPFGFTNPFDSMLTDGRRHDSIGIPAPNVVADARASGAVAPSLRNVALKPQFFSNGKVKTLTDVIRFYNGELGPVPNGFTAGGLFPPLNANQKNDVRAFFDALTDPRVAAQTFPFDRPTMHREVVPHGSNEFGTATPVTGPSLLAHVPLLNLDPHFKIGVTGAQASSTGVLGFSLAQAPGPLIWIGDAANPIFTVPIAADANGFATFQLGPQTASLTGLTWFVQGVLGSEATNAASFVVVN